MCCVTSTSPCLLVLRYCVIDYDTVFTQGYHLSPAFVSSLICLNLLEAVKAFFSEQAILMIPYNTIIKLLL